MNVVDPAAFSLSSRDRHSSTSLTLSNWTRSFDFDYTFGLSSTQNDLFDRIGIPMIRNALNGYNTSLFAYGQTGAGKTFTMLGPRSCFTRSSSSSSNDDDLGLIPRMCKSLIDDGTVSVEISFMEIYNERVRDLLTKKSNVRVREHPRRGVYVEDLSSFAVSSYDEVLKLLTRGGLFRTTSFTKMNSRSSRSHAIFQIRLRRRLGMCFSFL